jgi:hypothetical protein
MTQPRKPALPASLLGQLQPQPAAPPASAVVTVQVPVGLSVTVVVTEAGRAAEAR